METKLFFNNGRSALKAGLKILNLKEKDEVLVPDFDFAPQYNEETQRIEPASLKVKDNLIYGQDASLSTYPNKHWLDNVGFEITSCNISDKGIGYTEIPVIKLMVSPEINSS